jgi:ABC-2 type transport system permease protein
MSRPAPAWRSTLALSRMELALTARRGENLLVTIVIPAAVLVFFASYALTPAPGSRVAFLLPGAIALAIVATGLVNLGIATAYERNYGVLKRLGGSPLSRTGLVTAKILAVLVVEAAQIALLLAIGVAVLGWRPTGGGLSIPLLVMAVVLGTMAFVGLGLAMAGALRAETVLALANLLFVAFLAIGGIVVPVDQLPSPLAAISHFLPATALADLLRVAFGNGADPLPPSLVLGAWAAATPALVVATFRWE